MSTGTLRLQQDEQFALNNRGCSMCRQDKDIELLATRLSEERGKEFPQRLHDVIRVAIDKSLAEFHTELQRLSVGHEGYRVTPTRLMELMRRYAEPVISEDAIRNYWNIIMEVDEASRAERVV
jgi:hypothetical protein